MSHQAIKVHRGRSYTRSHAAASHLSPRNSWREAEVPLTVSAQPDISEEVDVNELVRAHREERARSASRPRSAIAAGRSSSNDNHREDASLGRPFLGPNLVRHPSPDAVYASTAARGLLALSVLVQMALSVVTTALIASNSSVGVSTYVVLLSILAFFAAVELGVHLKVALLDNQAAAWRSLEGSLLKRLVRNERRTLLFVLQVVLSCAALAECVYISRIAPSMSTKAQTFEQTGIFDSTHRAMDLLAVFVYFLLVPNVLLLCSECGWLCTINREAVKTPREQEDDLAEQQAARFRNDGEDEHSGDTEQFDDLRYLNKRNNQ